MMTKLKILMSGYGAQQKGKKSEYDNSKGYLASSIKDPSI
jgi:hypothetical protein